MTYSLGVSETVETHLVQAVGLVSTTLSLTKEGEEGGTNNRSTSHFISHHHLFYYIIDNSSY